MDEETRLEMRFYFFRLHLRKAAKAAQRLAKRGGKFALKLSYTKGGGLTSSFVTPDQKGSTEFAVLMSRFLVPGSSLHVDTVLAMLGDLSDSNEMKAFTKEAQAALAAAREGNVTLVRNARKLRAEDIFNEIARNVLFCDDVVRIEYERELNANPVISNLYWHTFYEYCIRVFEILEAANHFVEENGFYPKHISRENRCIYCGGTAGKFLEVEHIIPESLGNEELVLPRGYVCNECNNLISPLEKDFVDSLPMSMLRIFYTPYGKKGRFPAHSYPGTKIEKTSPNSLRIMSQTRNSSISGPVPDADGTYRFSVSVHDHYPFDPVTTARVLVKIAIGAIAAKLGRDVALDSRFDAAREFVRNGGLFPNRLVMVKSVNPRSNCGVRWGQGAHGGVIVELNLLGAICIVGLEPNLLVALHEDILRYAVVYDLWDDSQGPHHGAWTLED
jgi:hypothetical protein